jgi:hypothetical protein
MHTNSQITTDGPYLHVLMPDVVPPDWESLRRELDPEIDEGVTHITFALGRAAGVGPDDEHLLELVGSLRSSGVESVVLH